jgi:hypothetical protein
MKRIGKRVRLVLAIIATLVVLTAAFIIDITTHTQTCSWSSVTFFLIGMLVLGPLWFLDEREKR